MAASGQQRLLAHRTDSVFPFGNSLPRFDRQPAPHVASSVWRDVGGRTLEQRRRWGGRRRRGVHGRRAGLLREPRKTDHQHALETGLSPAGKRDVPDVALVSPGNTGAAVKDVQTACDSSWMPSERHVRQRTKAAGPSKGEPLPARRAAQRREAFRTAARPQPRSTTGLLRDRQGAPIAMIVSNSCAKWTLNLDRFRSRLRPRRRAARPR